MSVHQPKVNPMHLSPSRLVRGDFNFFSRAAQNKNKLNSPSPPPSPSLNSPSSYSTEITKFSKMGKAKRTKKSIGAAARTNPIKIDDPHLKKIHEEKVMPLVQKLKSVNPTERSEALLAIAHLVDDADFRKLLLREYIIQTCLERLLNDDDFTVSVRAWGVLRNIAVEEGHDICLFLYRNDVLVPVKAAIQKVREDINGGRELD